jgi:hypothetical protein
MIYNYMIINFEKWVQLREDRGQTEYLGVYTDENFEQEMAEDAENAYQQILKIVNDPLERGKIQWQHFSNQYISSPAVREKFINGAMLKIARAASPHLVPASSVEPRVGGRGKKLDPAPGFKRYEGVRLAKQFILQELQKGPISRKTAELAAKVGYTPTMTVSPQAGYTSQSFAGSAAPGTQQYFGLGINKGGGKTGRGLRTNF